MGAEMVGDLTGPGSTEMVSQNLAIVLQNSYIMNQIF